MSETQQQAAAPSFGNNIANMGKGWDSPFSKVDGKYNLAGALLVGGGSGLIAWALGRLLGLKSGASLGASILAGLGGLHGALAMQNGKGFFDIDHWRELMNMNRANGGAQAQTPPQEKSVEDNMSKEDVPQGPVSLMPENKLERNLVGEPPANLSMEEIEAGKTKSLLADKGRAEYMNMIRNGMVTPDAHVRAIQNGIRSNPDDPYVQQLIDAYAKRTDVENKAAQARWVDTLTNNRLNEVNKRRDPEAEADAQVRREMEAEQKYPEMFKEPVVTQGYGPEYREMFQPSNIVPNRGPSGFDPQNMSPHAGEEEFVQNALYAPQPAPQPVPKAISSNDSQSMIDMEKAKLEGMSTAEGYPENPMYYDMYERLNRGIDDKMNDQFPGWLKMTPEERNRVLRDSLDRQTNELRNNRYFDPIPSYSAPAATPAPAVPAQTAASYSAIPKSPSPKPISKKLPLGGNVSISPANQAWADVIQRRTGQMSPIPRGLR